MGRPVGVDEGLNPLVESGDGHIGEDEPRMRLDGVTHGIDETHGIGALLRNGMQLVSAGLGGREGENGNARHCRRGPACPPPSADYLSWPRRNAGSLRATRNEGKQRENKRRDLRKEPRTHLFARDAPR
jgi:hypothetical protein